MTPQERERAIGGLLHTDPALRRRLALRAGREAVRLRLTGPYSFSVTPTGCIEARIEGVLVASVDPWRDGRHGEA